MTQLLFLALEGWSHYVSMMSFPPVLTLLLAIGGGSGLETEQRGKEGRR